MLQHSSRAVQCPRQSGAPFRCRVQHAGAAAAAATVVRGCFRATAVLSGVQEGIVHVADWLGTLCHLAGAGAFARRVCLHVPAPTSLDPSSFPRHMGRMHC